MARKRLRKHTTTAQEGPRLLRDDEPRPNSLKRPREREHTATFWRNSYEMERDTRLLVSQHLRLEREINAELRAKIEQLTKSKPRRVKRRLS